MIGNVYSAVKSRRYLLDVGKYDIIAVEFINESYIFRVFSSSFPFLKFFLGDQRQLKTVGTFGKNAFRQPYLKLAGIYDVISRCYKMKTVNDAVVFIGAVGGPDPCLQVGDIFCRDRECSVFVADSLWI